MSSCKTSAAGTRRADWGRRREGCAPNTVSSAAMLSSSSMRCARSGEPRMGQGYDARAACPIGLIPHSERDCENGSDGTRTRDLRRDRPRKGRGDRPLDGPEETE